MELQKKSRKKRKAYENADYTEPIKGRLKAI